MNREIIVSVKRGTGGRSKYIYAEAVDAKDNQLCINATLDYVVREARARGYNIVNAQQVLNWLLDDGSLS